MQISGKQGRMSPISFSLQHSHYSKQKILSHENCNNTVWCAVWPLCKDMFNGGCTVQSGANILQLLSTMFTVLYNIEQKMFHSISASTHLLIFLHAILCKKNSLISLSVVYLIMEIYVYASWRYNPFRGKPDK
jgi:hypothetical protein